MIRNNLQRSFYIDAPIPLRPDSWSSAIKLFTDASYMQIADKVLMARGNYEVLDISSNITSEFIPNLDYFLASRQGLVCVANPKLPRQNIHRFRRRSLIFFWKILALFEFVAFKHQVYEDYATFLRHQVKELRDFRLSLRRKLTKEDLKRFSVYDYKIPQFLFALDKHIQQVKPFWRRVYTAISTGTGFDARRKSVMKLELDWEEEVKQWEPILTAIWKKLISSIRVLLGSRDK